jgi:predicted AlkP superfamily pyrophosphatase or phosphodiesterase
LKYFLYISLIFISLISFTEEKLNTVIVVSLDGIRFDYPERSPGLGFDKIEKEGLKAQYLEPVYQSSTFPAHVSMATGVGPDKHGILHNNFFDKEKGSYSYSAEADWIEFPPIWAIAEKQGIKTATYFWVGSETPWQNNKISYFKAPFNVRIGEKEKIEEIISWLEMPENTKPRLIMTWWHGADSIAHKLGPDDLQVTRQLIDQDRHLLNLINSIEKRGLWSTVTLLVVSDHGMSSISNFINIKEILKPIAPKARLSLGPAVGHVFLKDLDNIEPVVNMLRSNNNLTVYKKDELPKSLRLNHPSRTGDVVLVTRAPNMLTSRNLSNPPKGMHGYNPKINIEMNGIFYAYGNGVDHKSIGQVHQLDIVPTIGSLLNISLPNSMEGKIIKIDN